MPSSHSEQCGQTDSVMVAFGPLRVPLCIHDVHPCDQEPTRLSSRGVVIVAASRTGFVSLGRFIGSRRPSCFAPRANSRLDTRSTRSASTLLSARLLCHTDNENRPAGPAFIDRIRRQAFLKLIGSTQRRHTNALDLEATKADVSLVARSPMCS